MTIVTADASQETVGEPNSFKRHGDYRIVPDGYHGDLPRDARPSAKPVGGVSSNDPAVVRASRLFVALTAVPSDLKPALLDTYDGTTDTIVRQRFAGIDPRQKNLEVVRKVVAYSPTDVFGRPPSDVLEVKTGEVLGLPAVIHTTTEYAPPGLVFCRIQFIQDGVETIITGQGVTATEVAALAEEVAKAAEGR